MAEEPQRRAEQDAAFKNMLAETEQQAKGQPAWTPPPNMPRTKDDEEDAAFVKEMREKGIKVDRINWTDPKWTGRKSSQSGALPAASTPTTTTLAVRPAAKPTPKPTATPSSTGSRPSAAPSTASAVPPLRSLPGLLQPLLLGLLIHPVRPIFLRLPSLPGLLQPLLPTLPKLLLPQEPIGLENLIPA
ncbi:hypothetical protein N7462_008219 [Penicillium macrosclerotiorum]|uniref:uncharacterized protein n=1 Tax=Penicillium macrosclerotiorum TaxID=303699 RepID=UPI0025495FFF|nr:uncharacterized protein N7462_008219 [Penicillium macrosclerotiorum]KAJ5679975.1 hypothetical protein N7462_008219 [Penicillium macrosclerotiorum]